MNICEWVGHDFCSSLCRVDWVAFGVTIAKAGGGFVLGAMALFRTGFDPGCDPIHNKSEWKQAVAVRSRILWGLLAALLVPYAAVFLWPVLPTFRHAPVGFATGIVFVSAILGLSVAILRGGREPPDYGKAPWWGHFASMSNRDAAIIIAAAITVLFAAEFVDGATKLFPPESAAS